MSTNYNERTEVTSSYTERTPITSTDFITWSNSVYTWDNIPFTWDNANEGTIYGTNYSVRNTI